MFWGINLAKVTRKAAENYTEIFLGSWFAIILWQKVWHGHNRKTWQRNPNVNTCCDMHPHCTRNMFSLLVLQQGGVKQFLGRGCCKMPRGAFLLGTKVLLVDAFTCHTSMLAFLYVAFVFDPALVTVTNQKLTLTRKTIPKAEKETRRKDKFSEEKGTTKKAFRLATPPRKGESTGWVARRQVSMYCPWNPRNINNLPRCPAGRMGDQDDEKLLCAF